MAKDIFAPLLKKMTGMKGVKFTGGDTEQGIDVEYYELTAPDKKRKYSGIQFKKGNLKYGAGGNKNTVKEIKNQAEEAFEKDIHAIDNDSAHKLSRFICAVTGEINEPARTFIAKAKREEGGQVDFWDGQYLAKLIRDNYSDEFQAYFQLDEQTVDQDDEESATVVDAAYIEENYAKEIHLARAVKATVNGLEWKILRAVLKLTAFKLHRRRLGESGAALADVLLELERTEDDIEQELHHLGRDLEYLDFDNNYISLSGNAGALDQRATKIIEELADAEEESDPEEIFDEVVF